MNLYNTCLANGLDPSSSFYNTDGSQRRGTPVAAAFWDGFNGLTRSANAVPGTLSMSAFKAGKQFRKLTQPKGQA